MTDKFLRDPNIPTGLQIFHIDGLSNALNDVSGTSYDQSLNTTDTVQFAEVNYPIRGGLLPLGSNVETLLENRTDIYQRLINQTAVSTPVPITTLVGELDVAKIKSYQHNCELQFDDTDASLIADGTVTLSGHTITLSGTINVIGHALTNQVSFTQDQQLITKKYVDDANNAQNTFISTNTVANMGSVTVHQDVSDAGSGAIITTAERNAIGSNTNKTKNIIDTNNNHTIFNHSLEAPNLYFDAVRPVGNAGGEINIYRQNGTGLVKFGADGNFYVTSGDCVVNGDVSASSVIINGTTPITDGGSGSIITTAERTYIYLLDARTRNITSEPNVTTFAGTIIGMPYDVIFTATDEVNTITTTGQKMALRVPRSFQTSKIKVSLNSVGGSGFAVDIKYNGSIVQSIAGSFLVTNTTNTQIYTEDNIITVEVSNVGAGTATGLKIYLIGKTI